MILFILGIIVVLIAVFLVIAGFFMEESKGGWFGGGFAALVVGVLMIVGSTYYSQGVGDAKVITSAGKIIAIDETPGWSTKAPWAQTHDWDLLSQPMTFAGSKKDGTPQYTGGEIDGFEITTSVARGTQANVDLSVTYNLDSDKIEELYRKFRSQTVFTKQIVEPKVLSVVRSVPSAYEPVEFRGEKRGEATDKILKGLNDALGQYGITVTNVNLQDIRYPGAVEDSIKAVEVAQQKQAEAEANQRAAEVDAKTAVVKAQGEADAAVAAAQGQADANALLTASLTPQVLQQRYIDALKAGTVFVVPEGATPMVSVP